MNETPELPEVVEDTELPQDTPWPDPPPVMPVRIARYPDPNVFVNEQKHPGKDRFAARKGWRRG